MSWNRIGKEKRMAGHETMRPAETVVRSRLKAIIIKPCFKNTSPNIESDKVTHLRTSFVQPIRLHPFRNALAYFTLTFLFTLITDVTHGTRPSPTNNR